MKKISLIAAAMLASLSLAAHAAHAAHGGAAGGGSIGGMSSSHMSSHGLTNTNGPSSADRDRGPDRAADRRNADATSHENEDTAQGKHKHSSKHTK